MMDAIVTGPLRGPLRKRESHLWDRHPEDWYVEPPWVSTRLFETEKFTGEIHDPCCGLGHICASALLFTNQVTGSDLVRRSPHCNWEIDWLKDDIPDCDQPRPFVFDNIVGNPPFKLCDDRRAGTHPFVQRSLERSRRKCALLMPSNWIQGDQRSRWLEKTPLYRVYYISPRPSMPPGPAFLAGMKPGNGTTDYAWFVWLHGFEGRATTHWLRRSE